MTYRSDLSPSVASFELPRGSTNLHSVFDSIHTFTNHLLLIIFCRHGYITLEMTLDHGMALKTHEKLHHKIQQKYEKFLSKSESRRSASVLHVYDTRVMALISRSYHLTKISDIVNISDDQIIFYSVPKYLSNRTYFSQRSCYIFFAIHEKTFS